MTQKITIENSFGRTVEMTRSEYIRTWEDHTAQLMALAKDDAAYFQVERIVQQTVKLAEKNFDRIYKAQTQQEPLAV